MRDSMKKLFAACAVVMALSPLQAAAQTVEMGSASVTETTEFNPHWFMQLQAGAGYTIGEAKEFKDLVSPAAAIYAGYQFNPTIGLRFGVSGWQARGAWVAPAANYKFNYIQPNVDFMLSLTNLFCGFNPDRVLDFYGFVGFGGAIGFHNNEANELAAKGCNFLKLWSGTKFFPGARAGLGLNINVSPTVAINVEANANMLPDKFNSKKGSAMDWQYNALVGITYHFGGRAKKQVIVQEEVIAEPIPEPVAEPAPAPKPEPKPEPKPVVKPTPMTQDVFFTINSSFIRKSEQAKVDAIVEYMKANPETKVVVTGYADKETGTASYNLKLSQRRAESVKAALEKAGIAADRITAESKGDTVQPFEGMTKNRVAIAIAQ